MWLGRPGDDLNCGGGTETGRWDVAPLNDPLHTDYQELVCGMIGSTVNWADAV